MADNDASVQLEGVGSISSRGSGLIWVHFTLEHAFKGVSGKTIKALTYRGTSCDIGVRLIQNNSARGLMVQTVAALVLPVL